MSLKQHGHFATNGFVFPLFRQMLQNTEKSTLNLWIVVNRIKCKHWIFLSINKARNTDQSSYMGWNHRKHQPNGEGNHHARQKIPSIPWWYNLDQERWIWFRCYHGVIWWRRGVWTRRPVHVASSFTTVRYWFRRTLQGRWSHCPNPIQEASIYGTKGYYSHLQIMWIYYHRRNQPSQNGHAGCDLWSAVRKILAL